MKLTEDEVVTYLIKHLEESGWSIKEYHLGFDRGPDIEASKGKFHLLIEAKGARAGDKAHNKKRPWFNANQIKSHFGRALEKAFSMKYHYPKAIIAIAHPDDPDIRRHIAHLIPFLKPIGIKNYWVTKTKVLREN